jgi:DNA-binding MarR family transcriptional regulator
MALSNAAYARLLALRTGLRHFERWSERQARAAGLTPAQHQLLLAIRGHGDQPAPTIGEVADYLLLRHHSVVGLVDRAEAAGLVYRLRDDEDHRIVRLYLTEAGAARLEDLSALHLEELDRLALELPDAWAGLAPVQRPHGFAGPVATLSQAPAGQARSGRRSRRVAEKGRPGGRQSPKTKLGQERLGQKERPGPAQSAARAPRRA